MATSFYRTHLWRRVWWSGSTTSQMTRASSLSCQVSRPVGRRERADTPTGWLLCVCVCGGHAGKIGTLTELMLVWNQADLAHHIDAYADT